MCMEEEDEEDVYGRGGGKEGKTLPTIFFHHRQLMGKTNFKKLRSCCSLKETSKKS